MPRICQGVYQIGGSGLSDPYDCAVYIIDAGDLVLIDSGAGMSFRKLVANITSSGLNLKNLKAILVTHAHIDHIGALRRFRDEFGLQIIAHELDADNIEQGTRVGAEAYGVDYEPCPVDRRIKGSEESLAFGKYELKVIHIPGHTPGSISAYMDTSDGRVLFGQDIHGPYLPEWGGDRTKAKKSLQKLIDLKADILCEGHFGIYKPAAAVEKYIRGYLRSL
ncbi:MAG: MBL fold metallo-hydrolase [Chloroflexi bacterium]|nr:MBL fold metallo-hydrolase [Chloroflexota bacterium]